MFADTFVVPLDGSDFAARALPVARTLAWRAGARVELVTTRWDGDPDEPTRYLAGLVGAEPSIEVRPVLVEDRGAAAAIALVADRPGVVVCMTTHGRGRVRRAVLGSVAEEVVRTTTRPVLLVGRECAIGWANGLHRMVVAVDEATAAPAVLPEAIAWARDLDLDVVAVTVFHPRDPTGEAPVLDAVVAALVASGVRARSAVLHSSYPAGAIADFVDAEGVDLVAMSSHARTGSARFALGSVTMGVVATARCPVLVVRTTA